MKRVRDQDVGETTEPQRPAHGHDDMPLTGDGRRLRCGCDQCSLPSRLTLFSAARCAARETCDSQASSDP